MVLVTYDVSVETAEGRRRLRHVAKICEDHGQRVQNSVFECHLDPAQLANLKHILTDLIDVEKDSIRFYYLGNKWERKVEHIGVKEGYNPNAPIII